MKWKLAAETPQGSGEFVDTGEVFDDGQSSWNSWTNDALSARMADLSAQDGKIYQATWVPDAKPSGP